MTAQEQRIIDAAREALDAYEDRFESTRGVGNYLGPIDEEMKALRKAFEIEAAHEALAKLEK